MVNKQNKKHNFDTKKNKVLTDVCKDAIILFMKLTNNPSIDKRLLSMSLSMLKEYTVIEVNEKKFIELADIKTDARYVLSWDIASKIAVQIIGGHNV